MSSSRATALVSLVACALVNAQDTVSFREIDLTITEGTSFAAAVSPNRRSIAIDVMGSLWVLPFAGGQAQRITPDSIEVARPTWSPDSQFLAFEGYEDGPRHVYTIRRDGSDLKALTSGAFDDHAPDWSHDGTRIAFASDRFGGMETIWTVRVADGDMARISAGQGAMPCWAPDDREIAFVRAALSARGRPDIGLWAVDTDGRERMLLDTSSQGVPSSPAWSANGKQIAFGLGAQLMVDGRALTAGEDVFPRRPQWLSSTQIIYTADGHIKRRFVAEGPAQPPATTTSVIPFRAKLTLKRPTYTLAHRALEPADPQPLRGIVAPAVSPDGRAIAFTALGDLWVSPLERLDGLDSLDKVNRVNRVNRAPVRLTSDAYVERDPAWAPDGSRLAFSSDRAGNMDVWIHDLRTGSQTQISHEKAATTGAAWSPDGTRIAYLVDGARINTVRVAGPSNRSDGKPIPAQGADAGRPSWASDSGSIAWGALFPYAIGVGGLNQLLVHMFEPQSDRSVLIFQERSAGNRQNSGPVWSPDGNRMVFVSGGVLWTVDVDTGGAPTGPPRSIASGHPDSPSWEGDSRHLIYTTPDGLRRVLADGSPPTEVARDATWAPSVPPERIVVHAGHVFTGTVDGLAGESDIVIAHGIIQEIAAHDSSNHAGGVVDASEETVMPGLVEMAGPPELADSDALERMLLAYGITSARVLAVNPYVGLEQREALDNGRRAGPRVFMAGDPFDGRRVQAPGGVSIASDSELDEALDRATRLGADLLATRSRLGRSLHRRIPDYAHTHGLAATTPELFPALTLGYDGVEQLPLRVYRDVLDAIGKSAMTVPSRLGLAAISVSAARDRSIAQDPRLALWPSAVGRLEAFADASGPAVSQTLQQHLATLRAVRIAGGRIVAASDPSLEVHGLSLHIEIEHLVQAGLTPLQALRAATVEAATALGVDDVLGTIEPGKLADLTFISGDPLDDIRATRRVRRVMRGGRVYTVAELLRHP